MPSTRGRAGPHPLDRLLAPVADLPRATATADPAYDAADRELHADRFEVVLPAVDGPARALVLDDTWATGGRAQSLACAVRSAGADGVVVTVIGRLLKPEFEPANDILRRVEDEPYDIRRCASPNCLISPPR